jgi:hypothetical protein
MSSFNWSAIGSTLSGITTALTQAGVTGANQTPILQQIGNLMNPNQASELQICQQLLMWSGNPAIEAQLAMKLATTQGIPPAAAQLALGLTAPGVDVPSRVDLIEKIIKGQM